MEIKENIKNELFKRQELDIELEAEKSPSFSDVKKQIAEKVGKPEETIDVLKIKGSFGKNLFKVSAYVYDSKEDLGKMIELRKTKKQRKSDAEAKAEESKSEDNSNSEQTGETSENKPTESPVEERVENKEKAVKEQQQAKEEAKEN